jgi:hypothetical protein
MKPKKLEHYKYFQPIAWTLCLSFAGFVGMLALQIENEVQRMQNSTLSIEQRLQNVENALGVQGGLEAQ